MKNITKSIFTMMLLIPFFSADARLDKSITSSNNVAKQTGKETEMIMNRMALCLNLKADTEQVNKEDIAPPTFHRSLDITDSETDTNAQTFSGNKIIEATDTITSNIIVKGGDLTIYGTVKGDVLVAGGDLNMKSTGKITGDARVINGHILKEPGAVINGFEDNKSEERTGYREPRKNISRSVRTFDVPWLPEQINYDNFIFRYNRVESVFLGLGREKKFYWDGSRVWNAYGFIGWGFKSHTWRGSLGLDRQFAILSDRRTAIFELGIEAYSLTDTKDQWIISQNENTAAALLIHEDFRNYFERNGYTIHAAYYLKQDYWKCELKLSYLADSYNSMSNKVDWALFGGKKKFRINPAIDDGKMNSFIMSGGLSTITKRSFGSEGWSIITSAEFAKKSWGSAFDFEQYIFDVRRFQPLGRFDNFNIRLRFGSAGGTLPEQKLFELGGLGTMNAFPFKSAIGNRMLLINTEFIVNGSILEDLDFWPTWIFTHINLLLTSDAGFTRIAPSTAAPFGGFGGVKLNTFMHNFGVAIANRTGSVRIGVAWRTDRCSPAQFILRFSRPF